MQQGNCGFEEKNSGKGLALEGKVGKRNLGKRGGELAKN